jgi:hypothetical protein
MTLRLVQMAVVLVMTLACGWVARRLGTGASNRRDYGRDSARSLVIRSPGTKSRTRRSVGSLQH